MERAPSLSRFRLHRCSGLTPSAYEDTHLVFKLSAMNLQLGQSFQEYWSIATWANEIANRVPQEISNRTVYWLEFSKMLG